MGEMSAQLTRRLASIGHTEADDDEQRLQEECAQEVDKAVETYQALPAAGPEAMFDWLYASLPSQLVAQRDEAIAAEKKDG